MSSRAARGTIVFCHANGFPAGTYGALFEPWGVAGWRVLAPAKFGHDPAFAVTSGWPRLRDELLAFIEREAPGEAVALVGHSMGGYLSLLAASRKPAVARAVVLLDAPIVAGWRAHAFRALKVSGLIHRGGPGKVSARRRSHWPSMQAVREHYEARRAFASWDRRVFDDYLRHGFEPDPAGGVRLAFHRDVETQIYGTLPHHVQPLLRRHPLHCPVSYVGGTQSAENRQLGLAYVQRLAAPRVQWIEGSHLFPMEHPQATAQAVLRMLETAAG